MNITETVASEKLLNACINFFQCNFRIFGCGRPGGKGEWHAWSPLPTACQSNVTDSDLTCIKDSRDGPNKPLCLLLPNFQQGFEKADGSFEAHRCLLGYQQTETICCCSTQTQRYIDSALNRRKAFSPAFTHPERSKRSLQNSGLCYQQLIQRNILYRKL